MDQHGYHIFWLPSASEKWAFAVRALHVDFLWLRGVVTRCVVHFERFSVMIYGMDFYNPETATNREQCANMFCTTIQRLLAFTIRNVRSDECTKLIDEVRSKYRMAEGFLTHEQITEKIGIVLLDWSPQICAYDVDFFMHTDLASLIGDVDASADVDECPISDKIRSTFHRATSERTRTVIMDALNLLLILYARYRSIGS